MTTIVSGIVVMRKGENPSLVLEALKDKVRSLNESILPKGVKIAPYYDRHLADRYDAAHGRQEPSRGARYWSRRFFICSSATSARRL